MQFIQTPIAGAFLIEPTIFEDSRGWFFERFSQKKFAEATGLNTTFVQDNHSLSYYGVLRGLHFQKGEYAQAKLVSVLSGKVLDVIVDLRRKSPTFRKYFSVELSADNKKQLFVPKGLAHGFVTLSQSAEFYYKCDQFYNPQHEGGIRFDDPTLGIDWQLAHEQLIVSEKDKALNLYQENENYFD